MRPPLVKSGLILCVLVYGTFGCVSDNAYVVEPLGPREVVANASAAVSEAGIRSAIAGDDLEIQVPVIRIGHRPLVGSLFVTVVDVGEPDNPSLGTGSLEFVQVTHDKTHAISIPGAATGLVRPDTAAVVLRWSVEVPAGRLRGNRSLYAALGKIEIQLRGPTELPVGGTAPFTVIARDPDTLQPLAGAATTATLLADDDTSVPLFAGTTDANGELLVSYGLPTGIDRGLLRVEVEHGDSTVWTSTQVRAVIDRKVYLSANKTIYKPGQSIEMRALGLEGVARTPLAEREAVFEARDGKGNKVFKRRTETDGFGVASMTLPTDIRVNEGTWRLTVEIAGAKTDLQVPVEQYTLPKMKVEISTLDSFALPGETVYGKLEARYLFGEPVVGADVQVQATTIGGLLNAFVSGTTLADGSFEFDIPVPASVPKAALEDGRETLLLTAEVIDTAGQTEAGAHGLPLAAGPLVINALPESSGMVAGMENVVYLLVTDPVGRPLVADVDVSGATSAALVTAADGVAELRFTPTDANDDSISVAAVDGADRAHARSFELGGELKGNLLVRTDKAVYQAGDTATIQVFTSPEIERVYVDVFNGAQGVMSRSAEVQGGVAELSYEVTGDVKGMVVVDAFALAASAEVVRGSRRMLVDPRDELAITVAADQNSYQPGAQAGVALTVRDADGNPQVAAVGLNVVNEAAFALGGEPATDIRRFFNLDPRVLPADVRVAGRSAVDLFALGDTDERTRLAELLFTAAREMAGPGFEYNSVREELPIVRSHLEVVVRRDGTEMLKSLMPMVQDGTLEREDTPEMIEWLANRSSDPFGQLYRATVDTWQMQLSSAGPDEKWETGDDVFIEMWYDWLYWAHKDDVDADGNWAGGWFPGAMDDADANLAGGGECGGGMCGAPEQRADEGGAPGSAGVRVRSDFRETIYVNPFLITDASGQANVSFPLADSITSWRITAEGSTTDGKLGVGRSSFIAFQDFFVDFDVPLALTSGDELELPAIVYNYLPTPQSVSVTLSPEPWLTLLSSGTQEVTLQPSEVRAVKFRIRVEEAGEHTLTLQGNAGGVSDALVRVARVKPDGQPDEQVISDKLNGTREHTINVPADAVDNGTLVELTLTPGFAAEAVSGTEGMMQEPNGCFEQTTSSAWPNTMVANYLEDTGQMTDEMREGTIGMVTRGYQRLLTFESPTGGYNWWGDNDPGNRILSAIMLWHLNDLESLIEIDNEVRDRTLAWLLEQQNADGSWEAGDALHSGNEVLGTSKVRTTAFIGWALAHTGWADDATARAASWLRSNPPEADDLYANALAVNALAKVDPNGAATQQLFSRLDGVKEELEENRVLWPTDKPSWTGSSGNVAALETTGLVAYGMLTAQSYNETAGAALRFIIAKKDSIGTWYNTQATMNALRALSAAASPQGSDAQGTLTVRVNGELVTTEVITVEDGDVYRRIDITDHVVPGDNIVALDMVGEGELTYQLVRRSYRPIAVAAANGGLDLAVTYDTTNTTVGLPVRATIVATNNDGGARDQVLVRLGTAPGFVPRQEDLQALVDAGKVSRFEVKTGEVVFYLMGLASGEARQMQVRLTPTLAVEATASASSVYAYYEKTLRAEVEPQSFVITAP